MTILAFAMQKGGVGKTTTALAVGVELARLGKRVLLVDIDPQSNLTQALGYDPTQLRQSIHNLLLNPTHGLDAATLHTEHASISCRPRWRWLALSSPLPGSSAVSYDCAPR